MDKQFRFWRKWLIVLSGGITLFGLWMAFFSHSDLIMTYYNVAFWNSPSPPDNVLAFQKWVYGAWGGTVAGWGIFLIFIHQPWWVLQCTIQCQIDGQTACCSPLSTQTPQQMALPPGRGLAELRVVFLTIVSLFSIALSDHNQWRNSPLFLSLSLSNKLWNSKDPMLNKGSIGAP